MNFCLGRCSIKISLYFAITIAFVILLDNNNLILACLIGAFCHEIAHVIAIYVIALKNKDSSNFEIKFTPLGLILSRNGESLLSYNQEFIVSISGCACNFILALLLVFFKNDYFLPFVYGQLSMGIFNILPIYPLDGGVALEYLLLKKFTVKKADLIIKIVSVMFLMPIAIIGILVLFYSYYNFTLLAMCVYLIVLLCNKKI